MGDKKCIQNFGGEVCLKAATFKNGKVDANRSLVVNLAVGSHF
jgi:hypothetical protein